MSSVIAKLEEEQRTLKRHIDSMSEWHEREVVELHEKKRHLETSWRQIEADRVRLQELNAALLVLREAAGAPR